MGITWQIHRQTRPRKIPPAPARAFLKALRVLITGKSRRRLAALEEAMMSPVKAMAKGRRRPIGLLTGLLLTLVTCSGHAAPVMQTLYKFFPTNSAPQFPFGRLAEGKDGCFYGTTLLGGAQGVGVVFRMTTSGELMTLCPLFATNGLACNNGLTLGSDGYFYGAASGGGLGDNGTIFKVSTNGVLTRLYSFPGTNGLSTTNGSSPAGPLVELADGFFYGVTEYGGSSSNSSRGTIFKISTTGTLTTLFTFSGTNGIHPCGGLTLGNDGNLYGMTSAGGTNSGTDGNNGYGTVFRITTNGVLATLVHFDGTNGLFPDGGLALGSDGNFYGITSFGGPDGLVDDGEAPTRNRGSIFRMKPNGELTNLAYFSSTNGNGQFPVAGLTQGRDGRFYGATIFSGDNPNPGLTNYGTIFCISTNGEMNAVVQFNGTNGRNPWIDFTLGSDGNLYGGGEWFLWPLPDGSAGSSIRLVEPPVLTGISHTNSGATVTWTSFTNGIYQVEYKPSFTQTQWTVLASNLTATGSSTAFTDDSGFASTRYYRVRLLP
jgi:uncharacterized repeat protein (TIGR03803 family)